MTGEALVLNTTPIITFGYVIQVIISLAIIIGFIYMCAKFILPKLKVGNTGKLIKLVDKIFLEPQVSAYILKVKKAAWLVVVSNKQISRIDKIDEPIEE